MLRFWLALIPLFFQLTSGEVFLLRVTAESAFVRAAPDEAAEAVASVFQNQQMRAVGRSADGTWLQVERPSGWISTTVVTFSSEPTALPITDLTTGVTGNTPVIDTGFSTRTIDDAPLYALPDRRSEVLEQLAAYTLLPVQYRTPDNQWLYVNYRGTVGWLPQFLSYNTALDSLPVHPDYVNDSRYPAVVRIPPEVQMAQVDRLLAFINPLNDRANALAEYWNGLQNRTVYECQPVPTDALYYRVTAQDIAELPELRQMDSLLREAVDNVNASAALTAECGILYGIDLSGAYADAVSARSILRLIRIRVESIRERIPTAAG